MRTRSLILLWTSLVGASALPAPAFAQATDRVLVIYGNDKCPTDKNGEEIVVCARRPESERYRIPQNLRDTGEAGNERWGDRAASIDHAGATGIGSCSPVGPGGAAGCTLRNIRSNRAERERRKESEPVLPDR